MITTTHLVRTLNTSQIRFHVFVIPKGHQIYNCVTSYAKELTFFFMVTIPTCLLFLKWVAFFI